MQLGVLVDVSAVEVAPFTFPDQYAVDAPSIGPLWTNDMSLGLSVRDEKVMAEKILFPAVAQIAVCRGRTDLLVKIVREVSDRVLLAQHDRHVLAVQNMDRVVPVYLDVKWLSGTLMGFRIGDRETAVDVLR